LYPQFNDQGAKFDEDVGNSNYLIEQLVMKAMYAQELL